MTLKQMLYKQKTFFFWTQVNLFLIVFARKIQAMGFTVQSRLNVLPEIPMCKMKIIHTKTFF